MNDDVQVPLELPRTVYARLARLAKARGTTVTDVMTGEAVLLAREVEKGQAVLDMFARGDTVREIAAELGMTNTEVRRRMQTLGLRSNRT